MSFKNRIVHGGSCGYSGAGTLDSIENSDTGAAYNVTVESKSDSDGSTSQQTYYVSAGGTTQLGCTQAPAGFPSWQNTIVGEVKAP